MNAGIIMIIGYQIIVIECQLDYSKVFDNSTF